MNYIDINDTLTHQAAAEDGPHEVQFGPQFHRPCTGDSSQDITVTSEVLGAAIHMVTHHDGITFDQNDIKRWPYMQSPKINLKLHNNFSACFVYRELFPFLQMSSHITVPGLHQSQRWLHTATHAFYILRILFGTRRF